MINKIEDNNIIITVVSPVYKAENLVDKLVERTREAVSKITDKYEIILVEDRSPDNSWKKIKENCKKYKEVRGIRLSRNFGQQYAISTGFDKSRGEWVVVMDCDLQDNPDEIINLYTKAQEGYEVVLASRQNRKDSFSKKFFSKYFYKLLSYLTETHQDGTVANFAICHRKAIEAMESMKDHIRYFPIMIKWVGFNLTTLPVEHKEREDFQSSYSLKKRIKLAFNTILFFSDRPLRLTIQLGILILLSCFLFAIYLVVRYLFADLTVSGWMSTFLSIWFLSGLNILIMGMIGLYIGKILEGIKSRPTYIVDEQID
ncbi:MAG: glycosyltransferase family 2 protein [Actinomycetia bacterium]|nr:glycosyltransferase family 2 protein [Actinomycetes bacterium]